MLELTKQSLAILIKQAKIDIGKALHFTYPPPIASLPHQTQPNTLT
jgi:hypothetical protein